VLSENGLHEIAYNALNKKSEPSFGFWLADGATTTREFWNNEGSHNHPMFGGGLTWFYRKLAGMQTDSENPGYKHIIFKPQLIDEMSFVKYFNETTYGTAGIHWEKGKDGFHMNVTVPVGSTATVYLPAKSDQDVMELGGPVTGSEYIDFIGLEDGYAVYKVESGEYQFLNTKL
jgi:alpha-L-rhamnosidase